MSPTHLHLALTHIPMLGTIFAFALFVFAMWRRSEEMKKAALSAFVIVALLAVPAFFTGEPSEHVVESLPGVSKAVVDRHEDAALVAFIAVSMLGVFALGGLILFRQGKLIPGWYGLLIITASLIVSGLMAWTANLGGQVRHTEIAPGANVPAAVRHQDDD